MATTHLVPVEEYLHSTYEPDAEYVEGRIVPRSMPKQPHSKIHGDLYEGFCEVARPLGYKFWIDQRIRTQADPPRYRVPDLCLTLGEQAEDILTTAPFLCVEVLSPEDPAVEFRTKIDEYLAMGVPYVWIVDPISLRGEIYTGDRIERARDGIFRAGDIEVDVRKSR
jgi:Uma2 family endonuclease